MHIDRSCIRKLLFLCFRFEKISHLRKKICYLCLFALILVVIHIRFRFRTDKKYYYEPFMFYKRSARHRRVMCLQRFKSMMNPRTDFRPTPFRQHSATTPFCFFNKSLPLGPRVVNKTKLDMSWVRAQLPMVRRGGFHAPEHCRSRHKVAILVPYRDRHDNLVIFLHYMHPLFQKQFLQYRVFVIQQYGDYKFNKGALYNAAFIETQRFGKWDCLVFHDVDLIPLDERVLYTCPRNPTHMSPGVDYSNFTLQYEELFGGVTSMKPQHYRAVNGYSNYYWDWGAEDDDMYIRLSSSRQAMSRVNSSIARFATLPHKKQPINPNRFALMQKASSRFKYEGLNTVQYKLKAIYFRRLFTHIIVDVNPFNNKY